MIDVDMRLMSQARSRNHKDVRVQKAFHEMKLVCPHCKREFILDGFVRFHCSDHCRRESYRPRQNREAVNALIRESKKVIREWIGSRGMLINSQHPELGYILYGFKELDKRWMSDN